MFNQIPAPLVATFAAAHRSKVHAVLPVAQPSVVKGPYDMITTRAAGQVIGVVAIADATQNGGVKIDNSTAIAWSVTTTDTFGTPICTSLKTNPITGTCSVTIPRTTLLIGVGNGWRCPLPPNPVCSFPATGSPVSCFRIGIDAPIDGLRTS